MAITVSLFDDAARAIGAGEHIAGDTYKLKLYSAITVDLTDTTLAQVDAGGTEATAGTGYTAGGQALASVAITKVGNDAKFDAADVTWTAAGGSIVATHGVIYNDTDAGDPPLFYVNFDGTQTALDTANFNVNWNAAGIITFTVT